MKHNKICAVFLCALLICQYSYGQIKMVFRCDDYWMKPDTLQEKIVDLFVKHNVPLNFCIIPADTTKNEIFSLPDSTVEKWNDYKKQGLLDIGMHGFMHANLNPKYVRWNELENLSYQEQVERFTAGKAMIEKHFGRINYFVPPRNVINKYTLQALSDCGFDILSANRSNRISGKAGGVILYKCTTEDFKEFEIFYNKNDYKQYDGATIILLFHGYTFTKGRYSIDALEQLLSRLSNDPAFKFYTFNKLMEENVVEYDGGLQNKPLLLLRKMFGDKLFFLNNPSAPKVNLVFSLMFAFVGFLLTLPFIIKGRKKRAVWMVEAIFLILIGVMTFLLPIGPVKMVGILALSGLLLDAIGLFKMR